MRRDTRLAGMSLARLCLAAVGLLGVSTSGSLGQPVQASPINITNQVLLPVQVLPGINYQYANNAATLKNPGFEPYKTNPPYTVAAPAGTPGWVDHAGLKIDFGAGSGGLLNVNAQNWTLKQIHFHAAGEHRLHGQGSAMEMHMVHTRTNVNNLTELLVVGRWMDVGPGGNHLPIHAAANAELAKVINNAMLTAPSVIAVPTPVPAAAPAAPAPPPAALNPPSINIGGGFNPSPLIPAAGSQHSYRYSGSLTGPDERYIPVSWIMLHEKLTITQAQLNMFTNFLTVIGRPGGNGHGPVAIAGGFGGVQTDLPAPGAGMLLGVAGLFAVRRRRT